ncbi:ribonuclease H-like domain-containing protein [Tanacetum coccineum]
MVVHNFSVFDIDVDETFSPVVKPATIRTILNLTLSRHCPIHQLDVKNAFLHESLSAYVYMHYATKVLERAHMLTCNPCRSLVETDSKLVADGDPLFDPTLYRSLASALQYLAISRPYISYVVHQGCLFMHDPREPHISDLKRISRYIRGTLDYGLQLYSSSKSSLVAYSNADWAGWPTTHMSTCDYCVFLGNNLLSWSSKRQLRFPTLVLRLSIGVLITMLPKPPGYVTFYVNYIPRFRLLRFFIMTIFSVHKSYSSSAFSVTILVY